MISEFVRRFQLSRTSTGTLGVWKCRECERRDTVLFCGPCVRRQISRRKDEPHEGHCATEAYCERCVEERYGDALLASYIANGPIEE